MSNRRVKVAREDKILGEYQPEQLATMLDSGQFLESDLCSSEDYPDWRPMPDFLKQVAPPKYLRASRSTEKPKTSDSSRRNHRSSRNSTAALSGWIAFLLSLSVVVGAAFWIASLYSEIGKLGLQIREAGEKLNLKEKENQRLLFASREVAESGIIRGNVVLRNDAGKRVSLPGLSVGLYPRKAIEQYLEQRMDVFRSLPSETRVEGIQFFSTHLPPPLSTTMTDANGRFEFPITDPGEYVLVARTGNPVRGNQTGLIWFVAFNSQDPLNTLVQLNETNSAQQFVPSLMIVDGR